MADKNNQNRQKEYELSENDKDEAILIERSVIDYFSNLQGKSAVAGRGRNLNWLAAILGCHKISSDVIFVDTEAKSDKETVYAHFLSKSIDAIKDVDRIILLENLQSEDAFTEIMCKFSNSMGISENFPKRKVYEIIQSAECQQREK